MEKQKKELEEHRFEEATATNKTIKEQVRKDKLEWKLDELKAADEKGYKWDGLKDLNQNSHQDSRNLKTRTVDMSLWINMQKQKRRIS